MGKSGEEQTLQSKLKLTLHNLGRKIGNEQLMGITINCSGSVAKLQSKLKLTLHNLGRKTGNEQLKGITINCSGSLAKLTLLHFDSLASGVHVTLCLNAITTHAKQRYISIIRLYLLYSKLGKMCTNC